MMKWLLHRGIRKFARHYDYDASYMHEIVDVSLKAGLALNHLPKLSQFTGPRAARDVWAGAVLASTLDGDCGPCAQLVVDMALEAGVDGEALQACAMGQGRQGSDMALGFDFAKACIEGDLKADGLREEIARRYGMEAVIAASYAAATGRAYPVIKRGLGHGQACSLLSFGDSPVVMKAAE